jgi:sterol desaturase/sphingolipid hydroxylase (fatty acid hydroxylase superfamily)
VSQSTEITLRLGFFFAVFVVMTLWELATPRRNLTVRKIPRWSSNFGLVVINTVFLRLAIPVTTVAAAIAAEARGWGVFNVMSGPEWLEVVLAVIILDLIIYLQHVMFHHVPLLWRLHLVHHADLDFDVTTGVRFHTLEILLSALIKLIAIAVLGPSVVAVLVFEILLNATAMFNHSNIRLPQQLDRILRLFVVTPDMHRVHHSVVSTEMNSNFGFNLPWWDYLMKSYQSQPAAGHENMTIGVSFLREESQADRLLGMLTIPFVKGAAGTTKDKTPD